MNLLELLWSWSDHRERSFVRVFNTQRLHLNLSSGRTASWNLGVWLDPRHRACPPLSARPGLAPIWPRPSQVACLLFGGGSPRCPPTRAEPKFRGCSSLPGALQRLPVNKGGNNLFFFFLFFCYPGVINVSLFFSRSRLCRGL